MLVGQRKGGAAVKKTLSAVQCALAATLLTVCAWLRIPAAVPFTLQTFGVHLVLLLLGGRCGAVTVATYLLLGAVGLPVFASGLGGLSVLCGVTGGYLWGFLLIALFYWLCEKCSVAFRAAALAVGQLLCYAFGTVWFCVLAGDRFGVALVTCVLPFLLPDAVKLALALWLAPRLKKAAKL